jgi:hypothetical protein
MLTASGRHPIFRILSLSISVFHFGSLDLSTLQRHPIID